MKKLIPVADYLLSAKGLILLPAIGAGFALLLAVAAGIIGDQSRSSSARQPVIIEGCFPLEGQHPSVPPLVAQPNLRKWGSWGGADGFTGKLTIGPFAAPVKLAFYVSGYPSQTGISVTAINGENHESLVLKIPDMGQDWRLYATQLPESWRGRTTRLVAIDTTGEWRGWVGISEPVFAENVPRVFTRSVVVFLVFGACYLFLVVMAMHGIGDHDLLPLHWQALGGFAVTSLVTYLVFWLYFFDPGSGHVAVCMVAVVAILAFFHYRKRPAPPIDYAPVVMTILIAFLYLGITHFVALDEPLDYIAQARFRYVLPSDNSLSGDFAGMLFNGQAAKNIGTDWLTSDRPPLQTGWTLLCYGAGKMLGFPVADVGGWSGFWLQIAWVSAAYGLLREARLSVLRACAWTSLLAFSGFFLLNTVFVWPKLSASALGMGVFGLWIGAGRDKIPTKHFLAGGLFASLAWLSHGGIAFSFLTLGVWAFWRLLRRREWRGWGTAAAVFLLLALPWTAFQKFYAPPANRLFKWHLGGQVAVDLRSARETIHSAYSRLSTDEIVAAKINNFKMQVVGRFSLLWNLSERSTTDRRHEEFFYLFRALTWWIVGLAPAIFTCFLPGEISSRMLWGLLLWTASTVILWCLLMFDGAVIHQGSYAAVTGIFIACSLGLARFHRYTFPPFAIVIVAYTACTWWGPPQQLSGPINPVAAAIVALTLLPLIALGMASVAETLVARPHRIYTSNQNIAV